MRIAIDASVLHVTRGGTARYVKGVLRGFARAGEGAEITVLDWPIENFGYTQPWRAIKTVSREYLWARIIAPARLASGRFDLFHSPANWLVSPPKAVRHVVTQHDVAILRHPERFRRWHRQSSLRRLGRLHSADAIITVSRFTADEIVETLGIPARKLHPVHNGCDFSEASEERPPGGFPVPGEFFLFVGSLEPGKNLFLLREVYAQAEASGKPLPPLVVVGVRWQGVPSEGAWPAGWIFAGGIGDPELVFLYRRAIALVFPSKYEGFGLPPIEAMALGCPVICSRVASLPEVVGDAALCPDLNPLAYSAAMKAIAADGALRDECRLRGLERAHHFSWEKCASETLSVYEAVASLARRRL